VSLIAGIAFGILAYRFLNNWAITLLGAFVAGTTIFFIVDKMDVPDYVKFIITAVGAILGGYFGRKGDRYLKAGGTALLGSCLLMQGISFYVTTPDAAELQKQVRDQDFDPTVIGLIVGMLVFTALGTFVQLKYFVGDIAEEAKSSKDYTRAANEKDLHGW